MISCPWVPSTSLWKVGDSQFFKFKDDILPGYVWLVNNKIYPQGEVPGDSLYYGKDIELGNFSSEEFDKLDDAIEEYKKILLRYDYKNFKSLPQKLKLNRWGQKAHYFR